MKPGLDFTITDNQLIFFLVIQMIGVEKYIERADYNTQTLKNDIALLKLKSDITFTNKVKPACLPTSSKVRTKI